jgi:hypothetical protein
MAVGLVVSRVARLLELLKTRLNACVSDRKEGAVQVCRIRDLTLLTGYRLGIFWCHSGGIWIVIFKRIAASRGEPNSSYLVEMTRVGDLKQLLAG